jgi:hypothetical protein
VAWPPELRPDISNIIFVRRTMGDHVYWHGVRCKTWPTEQTLLWLRDYHRSSGQDFMVDRDAQTYVFYTQQPQLVELARQKFSGFTVTWQN